VEKCRGERAQARARDLDRAGGARRSGDATALTLSDWRPSYGGALRISWNLATIITADYGRSAEDAGLYINFSHIF